MAFPPATPVVDGVTVGNAAWWNAFLAELASALQNAGTPTLTPAQAIAELVAARGNQATLAERLANAIDVDGNPTNQVVPDALRNGLEYGNILANGEGLMWSRGPTAAPDFFTLGAGSIQQCGVGLADTRALNAMRGYSMRITNSGTPAYLYQRYVSDAMVAVMGEGLLDTQLVPVDSSGNYVPGYDNGGLIAWALYHVWCDGTNRARLKLNSLLFSEYHPGDSDWHPLIVGPIAVNPSVNSEVQLRVETAGTAYFQAGGIWLTRLGLPPTYVPARVRPVSYTFPIIATPTAATGYGYFRPMRPFYAVALAADVLGSVPTGGTTLKLDLMTPVGGTFVSLFAALPAFVASDRHLFKEIDTAVANQRRRTIRGTYAAGGATNLDDNCVLRLDVNTRDSGNTATNVLATVYGFEYVRPFEQFRAGADLSEA